MKKHINIALESAIENDMIAVLPKEHNWGTVRIQGQEGYKVGTARCILCNARIRCRERWSYDKLTWLGLVDDSNGINIYENVPNCKEELMRKALE